MCATVRYTLLQTGLGYPQESRYALTPLRSTTFFWRYFFHVQQNWLRNYAFWVGSEGKFPLKVTDNWTSYRLGKCQNLAPGTGFLWGRVPFIKKKSIQQDSSCGSHFVAVFKYYWIRNFDFSSKIFCFGRITSGVRVLTPPSIPI